MGSIAKTPPHAAAADSSHRPPPICRRRAATPVAGFRLNGRAVSGGSALTTTQPPQASSAALQATEGLARDVTPYDATVADEYFQRNLLLVVSRVAKILTTAARFGAVLAATQLDAVLTGQAQDSARPAKALQGLLTELGPSFIKLAQTLSMRPDLIGETYASALGALQDSVAPYDTQTALAILEAELGRPVPEVFSAISPKPVAAASLGQVYRGTLAATGQDVAIKVQRPGVERTIGVDVYLLRRGIGIVQRAAGVTRDLRVLAEEIGRALYGELDFRLEASNAAAFAAASTHLSFVTVPPVVEQYTTKRVLVSEWIVGQSPSQLLASKGVSDGLSCPVGSGPVLSLVRMGIQSTFSQLLVAGVIHGDPHSGNILLQADGRLCYLDHGLLVRVTPEHRQAMMAALIHLGLGEWRRLVDDLSNLDLLKPGTNRNELAADLQAEFNAVLATAQAIPLLDGCVPLVDLSEQLPLLSLQTADLNFSSLTGVLFRVAFKYKFLLPPYFPLVVRSISSLEGVALQVDPGFKLISAGMPIVLNQLLSDRRPTAEALLRELLLTEGGAMRCDDTAQQILLVWLNAAQAASGSGDDGLSMVDMLLNRRNAPLRRVLMDVNPCASLLAMPAELRQQLKAAVADTLGPSNAGRSLAQLSSGARAQRRRLLLLFKSSLAKVLRSPPADVAQLLLFTASIGAAVLQAKVALGWKKLRLRLSGLGRQLAIVKRKQQRAILALA